MIKFDYSIKELPKLCKYVDNLNKKIILLSGDLASGKTTFTKAFASYLKLKEIVASPTFSILNIYSDTIYHYDIYQDGYTKFLELGLLENLDNGKYHIIEWADENMINLLGRFGLEYTLIQINTSIRGKRTYNIS